MGNLLGAPVTEKDTHVGVTSSGEEYGVSSMQGWRVHMEDAHITETLIYASEAVDGKYSVIDLPGHSLFAVFDGHGGVFAAVYSGKNFCRVLSRQKQFIEYANFELERPTKEEMITSAEELAEFHEKGMALLNDAFSNAFVELDKEIYCALNNQRVPDAGKSYQQIRSEITGDNSQSTQNETNNVPTNLANETNAGTTSCVVLITPKWIICANAGDSRSVLSRLNNQAVALSNDHKPDDDMEDRRIRAAGGYVAGGRVEGDLAVSRGFGDYRFKNSLVVMSVPFSGLSNSNGNEQSHPNMTPGDQKVTPIPDVMFHVRDAGNDEFVIIACDGIWDVQSNMDAVQTVGDLFKEGESNLGLICEEFCDIGLTLGSKDNMTAMVIKFDAQKVGPGAGVRARRQLRNAGPSDSTNEKIDC